MNLFLTIFTLMKRNFTHILLIILVAASVAGCHKDRKENYLISGVIIDNRQSINVENVKVNLRGQKMESGSWNSNYNIIETQYTDNSGSFSFDVEADYYSGFKLEFEKSGYFTSEELLNPENLRKGEDYKMNYYIDPEAFISIHIKNNLPYNNSDQISVRISGTLPEGYGCCQDTTGILYGMNVDETTVCKVYGNSVITLNWNIIKNHVSNGYSEDINCPVFDTTYFELSY